MQRDRKRCISINHMDTSKKRIQHEHQIYAAQIDLISAVLVVVPTFGCCGIIKDIIFKPT